MQEQKEKSEFATASVTDRCASSGDDLSSELSEFFKLFADTTRIRILMLLDRAELCVCEISATLSMTESAVSHQLKLLRGSNLVKSERRGKHIYYSLADSHVSDIIERALDHISE